MKYAPITKLEAVEAIAQGMTYAVHHACAATTDLDRARLFQAASDLALLSALITEPKSDELTTLALNIIEPALYTTDVGRGACDIVASVAAKQLANALKDLERALQSAS